MHVIYGSGERSDQLGNLYIKENGGKIKNKD
jgi:hypothetical protein